METVFFEDFLDFLLFLNFLLLLLVVFFFPFFSVLDELSLEDFLAALLEVVVVVLVVNFQLIPLSRPVHLDLQSPTLLRYLRPT